MNLANSITNELVQAAYQDDPHHGSDKECNNQPKNVRYDISQATHNNTSFS